MGRFLIDVARTVFLLTYAVGSAFIAVVAMACIVYGLMGMVMGEPMGWRLVLAGLFGVVMFAVLWQSLERFVK